MAVTHFLPSFATDIETDASFTENNEKMLGILGISKFQF